VARRSATPAEHALTDGKQRDVYWLFVFVQLYLTFDYLRPQYYVPALEVVRPGLLLSVITAFLWLRQKDKSALRHSLVRGYGYFIFLSIASLLWCTNHYWAVEYSKLLLIYVAAGTLPIATVLSDTTRIKRFLLFWLTLQGVIAVGCIASHGVGPGGMLADENDFALCLIMALPYAAFLVMSSVTTKKQKFALSAVAFLLILAVATTLSRGGMLGLIAALFVVFWYTKGKLKTVVILILAVGMAVPFLPDRFFSEFSSINNTQDSTRVDRLRSWQMGWMMFKDSPLIGVGTGNYPWTVGEYESRMPDYNPERPNHAGRQAHSLWFTLIPEHGLLGGGLYLWLLFTIVRRCRAVIRWYEQDGAATKDGELLAVLAKGILGSLIGFLVAGTFISVLYYPHLWYLIGFAVGLDLAFSKARLQAVKSGSPGASRKPLRA